MRVKRMPKDRKLAPGDVYIGRAMPGFRESIWANPFKMRDKSDEERARVIAAYEGYIRQKLNANPRLRDRLLALSDYDLVCWCHNTGDHEKEYCHGDILIRLVNHYKGWLAAHPGRR